MKMAALQLMQQKANKDAKKADLPAIAETAEAPSESNASAAGKSSSKPATNGLPEPAAAVNGECKNPLEGKELPESIPGLAQAKELAGTLVAEDGSCIGTPPEKIYRKAGTTQGELLWWRIEEKNNKFFKNVCS